MRDKARCFDFKINFKLAGMNVGISRFQWETCLWDQLA